MKFGLYPAVIPSLSRDIAHLGINDGYIPRQARDDGSFRLKSIGKWYYLLPVTQGVALGSGWDAPVGLKPIFTCPRLCRIWPCTNTSSSRAERDLSARTWSMKWPSVTRTP